MPEKETKTAKRLILGLVVAVVCVAALVVGTIYGRVFRAPYPAGGKVIAWAVGYPEAAYNFAEVEPGRLYRSCRLDARWVDYLKRRYGVERIITLADELEGDTIARKAGMEVHVFDWDPNKLPPADELLTVVRLMSDDRKTLVHCVAGADRTGYAVAAYRVLKQGWKFPDAQQEMDLHYHIRRNAPALQTELRAFLHDQRAKGQASGAGGSRP